MDDMSSAARDAAKSATSKMREIFEQFKVPGFNADAFIEARQADIDAMSHATSIAFSGAQSITEKQAELLKTALGEINSAVKARAGTEGESGLRDMVKRESEIVQTTLSRTVESMKEMAEAAQKSQAEIYEIALDRVRNNTEALRAMFSREKP
ncbi:MAG: hypothetical protein NVS2B3_03880 [Vulcanimicrobiaceae bacterium]